MSNELEAIEARRALYLIERSIGEYGWFEKEELETELETLKTAIGELEELRKRNEPMKVNSDSEITRCPKCQSDYLGYEDKYCSDCGQALDWSDEK